MKGASLYLHRSRSEIAVANKALCIHVAMYARTHDQSLFLSDQCLQNERFQSFVLLHGSHMCTLKATKEGSMCTGRKAFLAFLLLIHSMGRCYTK